MRLQKVSPLCYEFVDINRNDVDRVLFSFFTPVVVQFSNSRTLVSSQALRRESTANHVTAALDRWNVARYDEVDGKELDSIVDPLNI